MTITQERLSTEAPAKVTIPVIDTDVHPAINAAAPEVLRHLPERWRVHAHELGVIRANMTGGDRPRHREFASRWDAEPPTGGAPGSNPDFAREQLLDKYDLSAAILNDISGFRLSGAKYQPAEMSAAFCRALNLSKNEEWLARDPRWYASINLPYEHPERGAEEIRFCKEDTGEYRDRWCQVMFAPDNIRPAGHQAYWPIYEAAQHYDIPIAFHVAAAHRATPNGPANYYFEEHCDFALFNFPLISSMIFEGVFDRFPRLKVVMVELGWSWAMPLAWRMDHAYRVMGSEVPDLQRLPSQYLADHFWYTTQPMEEPDQPEHLDEVIGVFEATGMANKLMYSSDYPHWDFDDPYVLPHTLSDEQRRRILGQNAHDLYGFELKPGTGVSYPA
jgi:predicted TIM-barrel fold metal-dependent hydrolase